MHSRDRTTTSTDGQPRSVALGRRRVGRCRRRAPTAIRDARPGSATFAQALVWASSSALFIAPGVPGDAVIFGPSEDDSATVAAVGLEPSRVRYLDGVLSAPFAAAGTTVSGQVLVRLGIDPEVPSID